MGSVEIDDKGLMASVTAPYEAVEAVLEATEGYVMRPTKIPKMTVIAGETEPVKAAMAMFEEQGSQALPSQHPRFPFPHRCARQRAASPILGGFGNSLARSPHHGER